MLRAVGVRGMAWGLWGGLCYTLGGLADLFHWPRLLPGLFGSHEVFHLFVMGGTFCHFIFMVKYVFPFRRRATKLRPAAARTRVTASLQPD
jgi:hemolysin III